MGGVDSLHSNQAAAHGRWHATPGPAVRSNMALVSVLARLDAIALEKRGPFLDSTPGHPYPGREWIQYVGYESSTRRNVSEAWTLTQSMA